jgi:hypothetical protein
MPGYFNRTQACRRTISLQLSKIQYNSLLLDAYTVNNPQKARLVQPQQELQKASERVTQSKKKIVFALQTLEASCSEHTRYPQLSGSFDVMNVFCSACGKAETADNDIIYCDRQNCNRAYHQKCLDVPLATEDIPAGEEDFFCDTCNCLLDCIDHINEVCETNYTTMSDLFPEAKDRIPTKCKSRQKEGIGSSSPESREEKEEELWPSDCSSDEDYTPSDQHPDSCSSSGSSGSDSDYDTETNNSIASDSDCSVTDTPANLHAPVITSPFVTSSVAQGARCRRKRRTRQTRGGCACDGGDVIDGDESKDANASTSLVAWAWAGADEQLQLLTSTRLRKRPRVDYVKLASKIGYDEESKALDNGDEDYTER